MKKIKPIIILTVLIVCSCTSQKREVLNYFSDIEELNTILLSNQSNLKWMNVPDSVSFKIPSTKEIIQRLKEDVNLVQIESHKTISFKNNVQKSGIAYYFGGNSSDAKDYMILIFGEDKNTLDLFKCYEQFSDCSEQENINESWIFIFVNPNCNN